MKSEDFYFTNLFYIIFSFLPSVSWLSLSDVWTFSFHFILCTFYIPLYVADCTIVLTLLFFIPICAMKKTKTPCINAQMNTKSPGKGDQPPLLFLSNISPLKEWPPSTNLQMNTKRLGKGTAPPFLFPPPYTAPLGLGSGFCNDVRELGRWPGKLR